MNTDGADRHWCTSGGAVTTGAPAGAAGPAGRAGKSRGGRPHSPAPRAGRRGGSSGAQVEARALAEAKPG